MAPQVGSSISFLRAVRSMAVSWMENLSTREGRHEGDGVMIYDNIIKMITAKAKNLSRVKTEL